jgi:hypothetical protein
VVYMLLHLCLFPQECVYWQLHRSGHLIKLCCYGFHASSYNVCTYRGWSLEARHVRVLMKWEINQV